MTTTTSADESRVSVNSANDSSPSGSQPKSALTSGRKATHFGECQVCGRGQKLPNGLLSLHGYTVQWNFFHGTCPGSKHLPFEQDKSLIEAAIVRAETKLASVLAIIEKLRKPATQPKAWYHAYVGGRTGYMWMKLDLQNDGNRIFVTHRQEDSFYAKSKDVRHNLNYFDGDLLKAATELNAIHADYLQRTDVSSLRRYIKWQQDRIANWKVQPLKALSPEGKRPEKPETTVRKAKAALNAEIDAAKRAYSKLADKFTTVYFDAGQANGMVHDRIGMSRQFDEPFHDFYYGPSNSSTVFNFVKRLNASKLPQPVKDALQPLLDQMIEAATKVRDLKAKKTA